MDIQRIHRELREAAEHFPNLEVLPTSDGGIFVKAAMQTVAPRVYILAMYFGGYPNEMPKVFVTKPALTYTPHIYKDGHICYMHPNMWNPGRHNIRFVLAQVAVWLNKYDVYQHSGRWAGPAIAH